MVNVDLKNLLATDAFEEYDFGEGVSVEAHDGWDIHDSRDFTKTVYVFYDNEVSKDTHKLSFHVRFNDYDVIDDVYALDLKSGNEIGCSPIRPG
ncbi:MAG: hypothetical protein QM500_17755 [Methylococcales bacterium]